MQSHRMFYEKKKDSDINIWLKYSKEGERLNNWTASASAVLSIFLFTIALF